MCGTVGGFLGLTATQNDITLFLKYQKQSRGPTKKAWDGKKCSQHEGGNWPHLEFNLAQEGIDTLQCIQERKQGL